MATAQDIYQKSLELLTRREHSVSELRKKLDAKFAGCENIIADTMATLIEQNYLSDARYAEAIISYRAKKGYGPNWIKAFLYTKGVDQEVIQQAFEELSIDWQAIISRVNSKKFGKMPDNYQDKAKAMNFYKQEGFPETK